MMQVLFRQFHMCRYFLQRIMERNGVEKLMYVTASNFFVRSFVTMFLPYYLIFRNSLLAHYRYIRGLNLASLNSRYGMKQL